MEPAHWSLLNIMVGLAGGALTVGAGAIIYAVKIMDKIDARVSEKIILSLANGAGLRVREIVHSAVTDAMAQHQNQCPLRDRVGMLEQED